jgi:hypothetical protein
MVNEKNGNQFRDDEIIILDQLREGKMGEENLPEDRREAEAMMIGPVPSFIVQKR